MTFNPKFGLLSICPFLLLLILYPILHIFIQNPVFGLLISIGIVMIIWKTTDYVFLQRYFKGHPRLNPMHYEFNAAANTILCIGALVLFFLIVVGNVTNNPFVFFSVAAFYYFLVNGTKTYREISR